MNHFRNLAVRKAPFSLLLTGFLAIPSMLLAEESSHALGPVLQNTTISGYIDTSIHWHVQTEIPEPSLMGMGASAVGLMLWMVRKERR